MAAGSNRLSLGRILVWSGLLCLISGAAIVMGSLAATDLNDPAQAETFLNRTSLLANLEESDDSHCSKTACPQSENPSSSADISLTSLVSAQASKSRCPSACGSQNEFAGNRCSDADKPCEEPSSRKPLEVSEMSAREIVAELTQGGPVSAELLPLVEEPQQTVASDIEIQLGEPAPLKLAEGACSTLETSTVNSNGCRKSPAVAKKLKARSLNRSESRFLDALTRSMTMEAELRTKFISELTNATNLTHLRSIQAVPFGLGLLDDVTECNVCQTSDQSAEEKPRACLIRSPISECFLEVQNRMLQASGNTSDATNSLTVSERLGILHTSAQISDDKTTHAVDVDLLPPQAIFRPIEEASPPVYEVPPQPEPIHTSAESEAADCPKAMHMKRAAEELDKAGLTDNAAELRKQAQTIQAEYEAEQARNMPEQLTVGQVRALQQTLTELRDEVKQLKQTIEGLKQEVSEHLKPKAVLTADEVKESNPDQWIDVLDPESKPIDRFPVKGDEYPETLSKDSEAK